MSKSNDWATRRIVKALGIIMVDSRGVPHYQVDRLRVYAVLRLLRQERAAMVRLVKQVKSMRSSFVIEAMTTSEAYSKACDDLLAALKGRPK